MLDRLRRLLNRAKREPVVLGAIVSVGTVLGLDDLAAEIGYDLTQANVALVIGAIVAVLRVATNSRTHTREVESERDGLRAKVAAATEAADPHPHGAD